MSVLQAVAAVFGTIFVVFYLIFKWQYQFWPKLGFPYAAPSFPWGNVYGIATKRQISRVFADFYFQFPQEKFVGFWLFFKPILLVRDPELAKSICVRDFHVFQDRGIHINEKEKLSAFLFSLSGTKWKKLRQKLTPAFTPAKTKMLFPIMWKCSESLSKVLEGPAEREEVIQVKEYANRYTIENISLIAFGLETDCINNPDAEFRKYGEEIFDFTLFEGFKIILQVLWPGLYEFLGLKGLPTYLSDFFFNSFKQNMNYREENNVRRNDIMDLLIQLKTKGKLEDDDSSVAGDDSKITIEEAASQAFFFFAAAFETSASTIQFALYELSKKPETQDKLRSEIDRVISQHNGEVTHECLNEMEYLGQVIDETLRLHSPLAYLQRIALQDYKVPGTDLILPKGTQVVIPIHGLQTDPAYFPEPEKFQPERFSGDAVARNAFVYLPFGEGPRYCIGKRYALLQAKLGLMNLIRNYQFSVAKETPIPLVLDASDFLVTSKFGMPLKISKIKLETS